MFENSQKSLILQQTTKRATFNFKSFFARKFKYFEKIVKICLHSSFHFDDFLRHFSNTMTIVTFIKEDLISDSWRNKESSCQNRFCCLMNNLWHHHPSYLIYAIHSRKTLRLRGTSAKHARTA